MRIAETVDKSSGTAQAIGEKDHSCSLMITRLEEKLQSLEIKDMRLR